MLRARMKRRNVWNSLFRSLPSKVCFGGDMFLYFLPAFCMSPYGPTCCLSSPSLLSSPASSPAFCCYLSVSLFPMSFQFSNWFFYSVSPSPSITYPRSTSMCLPFPGSPWHIPVCFPIAGPMWNRIWEDHGYIFNTFIPNASMDSSILFILFLNSLIPLFIHLLVSLPCIHQAQFLKSIKKLKDLNTTVSRLKPHNTLGELCHSLSLMLQTLTWGGATFPSSSLWLSELRWLPDGSDEVSQLLFWISANLIPLKPWSASHRHWPSLPFNAAVFLLSVKLLFQAFPIKIILWHVCQPQHLLLVLY